MSEQPAPYASPIPEPMKPPARNPLAVVADLLLVRHPGKIVIDGILIIAASNAIYLIWDLCFGSEARLGSADQRFVGSLMSSISATLWWAGVLLASTGIARILGRAIGEGVAARRTAD